MHSIRKGVEAFVKAHPNNVNSLWHSNLETQVNVKPAGERDDHGQYQADGETFGNIRWPTTRGTDPSHRDLTFNPETRADRIGSTWWDYVACESVAVGLDIDATGKADHVNQHDGEKLADIVAKLSTLPYVSICPSTRGRGFHCYVFFTQKPKTANHTEHQLVGEQVVRKMADDLCLPFDECRSWFDKFGQVLWFWASNQAANAFMFNHTATENLNADELPPLPVETPKVVQPIGPVSNDQLEFSLKVLSKVKPKPVEKDGSNRTMKVCHRLYDCGITDSDQAYGVFEQYARKHPFPNGSSYEWFEPRFNAVLANRTDKPGDEWLTHLEYKTKKENVSENFRVGRRDGSPDSFYFRRFGGKLDEANKGDARDYLMGNIGLDSRETKRLMQPDNPWTLTNEAFAKEYPKDNVWNLSSLKYAVAPNEGTHEHFDKILRHLGKALDVGVSACEWCDSIGITNGYDYLFNWAALVFQKPYSRLPGLGFYSAQNNGGKSIFVNALGLLVTGGICRSTQPIKGNHNEQLIDCLLYDLDDHDCRRYGQLVKQIMTQGLLDINPKGRKPFQVRSCLHFVQSTNNSLHFPVLPQDDRWTIAEVEPLLDDEIIPQPILVGHLKSEAPAFLNALLNHKLHEPVSRLWLPVLETPLKTKLMNINGVTDSEDAQRVKTKLVELAHTDFFGDWVACGDVAKKVGLSARSFGQYWRNGVEDHLKLAGFDTSYKPKQGQGRPPMYRVTEMSRA